MKTNKKIIKIGTKISYFLITVIILSGCATTMESMPGFTHTAFLPIGAPKSEITPQVEHLFGAPIKELHSKESSSINEYKFTAVYNLLLYFYSDTFVQADLRKPDEKSIVYPPIREDFKTVTKENPGSEGIGYFLTKNNEAASIKTLYK